MRIVRFLLVLLVLQSCGELYFDDEIENSPESNFELFWSDFDRNYGQFDIRGIDWQAVYTAYRPKITASTTDFELFEQLNQIIQLLKDGHVNLYSPFGVLSYTELFPNNYTGNMLINPDKYIRFSSLENTAIRSGDILNTNLGYIQINTFVSNTFGDVDNRYALIDAIIDAFKYCDGLIIDVRGNGGGNSANALTIASRFANTSYLYYQQRYKKGPEKSDFSEWINFHYSAQGPQQYSHSVVVLTSRCTFSAAEIFVSAMQVLPHVTLVGDTTTGGIGNPMYCELPNGWTYRLSTSVGATAVGSIIDGKGIAPEIVITPSSSQSENLESDLMLEKAIEVLLQK